MSKWKWEASLWWGASVTGSEKVFKSSHSENGSTDSKIRVLGFFCHPRPVKMNGSMPTDIDGLWIQAPSSFKNMSKYI